MLKKSSILDQTALDSPLKGFSTLKPNGSGLKKALVATVILTSLIDAFSILVIYLLFNSSNSGEILYISKDMELPSAIHAEELIRTTLVKIEKGQIFIEEKLVKSNKIVEVLVKIKKELVRQGAVKTSEGSITIQADKGQTYDLLNQVILASSHAGFNKIKFAVLAN